MAEVKWIKIVTDVFDNRKIKQIETMPDADSIIVIWFKILCLAGRANESGLLLLTQDIAYTDEMLANEFKRPISTIRLALNVFEKFGMIEIVDNILCISNWEKYQNAEQLEKLRAQTRKRVSRYRETQKQLAECNAGCNAKNAVTGNANVTQCNAVDIDKEVDIDKDKDKDKEIDIADKSTKPPKSKYGELKNVLLTAEEYEKLKERFPDYEDRINKLGYYISSRGKKYNSHYATVLNWARKDEDDDKQGAGSKSKQDNAVSKYNLSTNIS